MYTLRQIGIGSLYLLYLITEFTAIVSLFFREPWIADFRTSPATKDSIDRFVTNDESPENSEKKTMTMENKELPGAVCVDGESSEKPADMPKLAHVFTMLS